MDTFICNKCFVPAHRGKKPFCLTQCGHIYCNGCIKQAETQCPQCQQIDIYSVELQQPSLARVENFFAPLNESLESLNKTCAFQNAQMRILLQRFLEIDKKYETLKSHYYNITQSVKAMKEKYIKLKIENGEQKKKLLSYELHNRTMNSLSNVSTPMHSDTQKCLRMRNTASTYLSSCGIPTPQSSNPRKGRNTLEGFRIPPPQSRRTLDKNPRYTFTH